MSTPEEWFEQVIEMMVEQLTTTCASCEGSGTCSLCIGTGDCIVCKGVGSRIMHGGFVAGAEGVQAIETEESCEYCEDGRCNSCHGTKRCPEPGCENGKNVPDPMSPPVLTAILSSAILQIRAARDSDRFDTMNRFIDMTSDWITSVTQSMLDGASNEEREWYEAMFAEGVARGAGLRPEPKEAEPPPTSSAMTEEELRELGITEKP